jgi:hypothetical protein
MSVGLLKKPIKQLNAKKGEIIAGDFSVNTVDALALKAA